jgi:hypothetical protein
MRSLKMRTKLDCLGIAPSMRERWRKKSVQATTDAPVPTDVRERTAERATRVRHRTATDGKAIADGQNRSGVPGRTGAAVASAKRPAR